MSDSESKFARSAVTPPKRIKNKTPQPSSEKSEVSPGIVITNEPATSASQQPVQTNKKRRSSLGDQIVTFLRGDELVTTFKLEDCTMYAKRAAVKGQPALTVGLSTAPDNSQGFCAAVDEIHRSNPLRYTEVHCASSNIEDYFKGQGWQPSQPYYLCKEATLVKAPPADTDINDRIQRMRERAKKKLEENND